VMVFTGCGCCCLFVCGLLVGVVLGPVRPYSSLLSSSLSSLLAVFPSFFLISFPSFIPLLALVGEALLDVNRSTGHYLLYCNKSIYIHLVCVV
jgi:hypothetical protein